MNILSQITPLRQLTYTALGFLDQRILKRTNPIFILSYHSVASDDWRFSVDASVVKKQILYLKKHFTIITLELLADFLKGKYVSPKPAVVLTFDDGYKDILTLKEFFAEQNIKPAIFLLGDTNHPDIKELGTIRPFLNKTEIKSLIQAGWEIGCHSATHANLATLSDQKLQEEIVSAKKSLEKELGIPVKYFAYPRGKYNSRVLQFIKKAGYDLAFTMDDGIIKPNCDIYTLPRVGVDRTHSFSEFTAAFSPSVVQLRQLIKKSLLGRYL